MLIGLHISATPNLYSALRVYEADGGEVAQVFGGNPQSFYPREMPIGPYRGSCRIVLHAPYTINLADPADGAISGAIQQVRYAAVIGASHVVFHAGSSKKEPHAKGLTTIRQSLLSILEANPLGPRILIENTAQARPYGTSGSLGAIETLLYIIDGLQPMVGVCLDVAHAFAADDCMPMLVMVSRMYGGLSWIPVVHANVADPDVKKGSRRDRHGCKLWDGAYPAGIVAELLREIKPEIAIVEATTNDLTDIERLRSMI